MANSSSNHSRRKHPAEPTPRDQVLAEWRGIDLAPLERANAMAARSTAEIMPAVLKKLRVNQRQIEVEILKVWNHIIDPLVVAHARPTGLCKGTLFVSVDSSVWLDEIVRYRREEILTRLQHSFGSDLIKRISFKIG